MVAKGPHKGEMPTELNFKHDGGQKSFACSACELIPRSHTFKMMAPPLNVVHWTSTDQVSNSMLLELKRGGRKGVGKGWRQVIIKTNTRIFTASVVMPLSAIVGRRHCVFELSAFSSVVC